MDRQELREMFGHFDADSNGVIDRTEFGQLMNALEADMSDEEVDVGFATIDADGNGSIEFSEFIGWWDQD